MRSITRISIWVFWALILNCVFAGYGKTQSGETIYTQTTHACVLTHCSDAQFNPTATLSYSAEFTVCGEKQADLIATWNGTTYQDGKADMNFIGSYYNGHNYYPWAVWETRGTFNNGTITLVEHVASYRNCSGTFNIDGSVIAPTQPSSDQLVGGGTGGGGH